MPQKVALSALRGYKLLISPLFAGSCRFVPSCSDYARDAIVEHGVLKGSWLAVRRLSRCHPLGSSGFDPVPRRVSGVPWSPGPWSQIPVSGSSSLRSWVTGRGPQPGDPGRTDRRRPLTHPGTLDGGTEG